MSQILSRSVAARFSLPLATAFALVLCWSDVASGEEPSLTMLRQETRDLLRQQATLPPGTEKNDATTALCDLYVVLRNDSRYSSSKMLRGDASKIRRRLLSTGQSLQHELRRNGIERPEDLSERVESAISAALADEDPPAGAAGGAAMADNGWQLVELIQQIIAPDFWEQRGGPGSIATSRCAESWSCEPPATCTSKSRIY